MAFYGCDGHVTSAPRGLKIGKHEKGKRDLIILLMAGEEPGDEMI
jgi:hypothetical protein